MLLEFKRWVIPPGHQVLLQNVSWSELEQILDELGENRATRISYSNGTLELMTPLATHENNKAMISDFVRILLEELGKEYRNLGSTTLKNAKMKQAVEPDECFYIQNEHLVRGIQRLDLSILPPPDLAIEIDLTARTRFNHYEQLGVPELWRYDGTKLEINILSSGKYLASEESLQFSGFPLKEVLPQFLEATQTQGKVSILKQFRDWVIEQP
ncbi:MAG: Uma2 family endonuclease, partial [Halothece sp.]